MSRGIRRGICCRCLSDACSASPIKLGEMRKTKLYQSCHASRPRFCHRSHRRRGITSACAEQTAANTSPHSSTTDHLRVCGADPLAYWVNGDTGGSPPRVRSRPICTRRPVGTAGITSACAEQTSRISGAGSARRDHLRVCGADRAGRVGLVAFAGSPPRVRSRQRSRSSSPLWTGITSACAEQTWRRR